jgi:hypothetical protein
VETSALIDKIELEAMVTPTRRFAATSPLKGEVSDHQPISVWTKSSPL